MKCFEHDFCNGSPCQLEHFQLHRMLTDIYNQYFFMCKLCLEHSLCFEGLLNYRSILCHPQSLYFTTYIDVWLWSKG